MIHFTVFGFLVFKSIIYFNKHQQYISHQQLISVTQMSTSFSFFQNQNLPHASFLLNIILHICSENGKSLIALSQSTADKISLGKHFRRKILKLLNTNLNWVYYFIFFDYPLLIIIIFHIKI